MVSSTYHQIAFSDNSADLSDKDKGTRRLLKSLLHNPVGHRKVFLSASAKRPPQRPIRLAILGTL